MTAKALVGGVGMIKFKKPGENEGYEVMSEKAIRLALEDAGIAIDDIQQAYASYCYGDSANGQSVFIASSARVFPFSTSITTVRPDPMHSSLPGKPSSLVWPIA